MALWSSLSSMAAGAAGFIFGCGRLAFLLSKRERETYRERERLGIRPPSIATEGQEKTNRGLKLDFPKHWVPSHFTRHRDRPTGIGETVKSAPRSRRHSRARPRAPLPSPLWRVKGVGRPPPRLDQPPCFTTESKLVSMADRQGVSHTTASGEDKGFLSSPNH